MATESGGERRFWRIAVRTALVGGVLVLIPLLFEVNAEAHPRWHVVLGISERLGDALLIAAALAVFIERSIGNEHFYRLIVDVFGRKLPSELVGHLQNYFQGDFVRRDWSIEYVIEPVSNKSGEFTLTATSSYCMENRSTQPQQYPYRYSVELGYDTSTETKIIAATIANQELSEDEIKQKSETERGYLTLKDDAVLKPFEANPAKYEFRSESIQGFHGEKVSPYWSRYPVVGTTFKVYFPERSFNVILDATFEDHSGDGEPLDDKKLKHLVGRKWEISTPILRGQGFVIRCTPAHVTAPPGATHQA
jgi:hypothetical protein